MEPLAESIKAWEQKLLIAKAEEIPKMDSTVCPCCVAFPETCLGCPIADYTGARYCENTPYVDAYNLVCDYYAGNIDDYFWGEFEKAIEREIKFLKTVLDAEKVASMINQEQPMSTIRSREVILEILRNNGIYMTGSQLYQIWMYVDDLEKPSFKLSYSKEDTLEFLVSPFAHSPSKLWSQESGLTEYAKTLFTEL